MKNQLTSGSKTNIFILFMILLVSSFVLQAQDQSPLQKEVIANQAFFKSAEVIRPMSKANIALNQRATINKGVDVDKAIFLTPNFESISEVMNKKSDKMVMAIPLNDNASIKLHLLKAKVFSDEFNVYAASNRSNPSSLC